MKVSNITKSMMLAGVLVFSACGPLDSVLIYDTDYYDDPFYYGPGMPPAPITNPLPPAKPAPAKPAPSKPDHKPDNKPNDNRPDNNHPGKPDSNVKPDNRPGNTPSTPSVNPGSNRPGNSGNRPSGTRPANRRH